MVNRNVSLEDEIAVILSKYDLGGTLSDEHKEYITEAREFCPVIVI